MPIHNKCGNYFENIIGFSTQLYTKTQPYHANMYFKTGIPGQCAPGFYFAQYVNA